MENVDDLFVML